MRIEFEETAPKGIAAMSLRDAAELVSMPRLLCTLGFELNQRTRRCRCLLHGGSNCSAFSWHEDGRWHCFSCLKGGDRIALVRTIRACNFAEAVEFLAALAGVECEQNKLPRAEAVRLQKEREAEEHAAQLLANKIQSLVLELSEELDALRRLRRVAEKGVLAGKQLELCREALRFVADTLTRTDAAYCIAAFASGVDRARFALHPELRPAMIDAALELGWVGNGNYRCEVPLQ